MAAVAAPVLQFQTADLAGPAAFETWRSRGWPGFASAFEVSGPVDRFRYTGTVLPTPRLQLLSVDISGLTYQRTAARARRDGRDQILVQATLSGGNLCGVAGGRRFDARGGSVQLVDFAGEIAQSTVPSRVLCLLLDRDLLADGGSLPERLPAMDCGPLVGEFLQGLAARMTSIRQADVARLERSAAAVVRASLYGRRDDVAEARPLLESLARRRARAAVAAAQSDRELTPQRLAAVVGVSRATLYRLFEREGGVARFIREQRLEVARAAIQDPGDRRGLFQIARAAGFGDHATFSRAFRSRYGLSPSDLRPLRTARA